MLRAAMRNRVERLSCAVWRGAPPRQAAALDTCRSDLQIGSPGLGRKREGCGTVSHVMIRILLRACVLVVVHSTTAVQSRVKYVVLTVYSCNRVLYRAQTSEAPGLCDTSAYLGSSLFTSATGPFNASFE